MRCSCKYSDLLVIFVDVDWCDAQQSTIFNTSMHGMFFVLQVNIMHPLLEHWRHRYIYMQRQCRVNTHIHTNFTHTDISLHKREYWNHWHWSFCRSVVAVNIYKCLKLLTNMWRLFGIYCCPIFERMSNCMTLSYTYFGQTNTK